MKKRGNGGHDQEAISILSGQQMKVLEFARVGVTKPSEMAERMGITTKAVRSYIKRALEIVGARNLEHALLILDYKPIERKEPEFIPLDLQRTITRLPDHVHGPMGK
mgnify:CR=1 FL=1